MPFQLLREKLPTPHVRRRKMTPHAWRMTKAHTYGAGAVGKERGPRRRAPAPRQKGAKCQRPYRVENTGSLPNSAVKQRRARLVLGWGTAWESLGVLLAFFFSSSCTRPVRHEGQHRGRHPGGRSGEGGGSRAPDPWARAQQRGRPTPCGRTPGLGGGASHGAQPTNNERRLGCRKPTHAPQRAERGSRADRFTGAKTPRHTQTRSTCATS